jgi:DNA-binding response OmpR family regulator
MTRVLIVEDNEANRDMLDRRLIRRGFDVLFAEDGHGARVAAPSKRPDIFLMDAGLPEVSGLDATRALEIRPMDIEELVNRMGDLLKERSHAA